MTTPTYRKLCLEAVSIMEQISKHGPQGRLVNRWLDDLSRLEEDAVTATPERDRLHQYMDARRRNG